MATEPIVFMVDDDESLRTMLARLLRSVGLTVVTCATAEEFLNACKPDQPGCLVLDVRMPGMSGLELQDELNARRVTLPIIFLSGHGDVPMAVRGVKAGAIDFLEKPVREQVLLDRIRQVLAADSRRREIESRRRLVQARTVLLTPREREVMDLFVAGETTKEVAFHLGISRSTAEVHRIHILEKMEVDSLVSLIRMVLVNEGLGNLPPPPPTTCKENHYIAMSFPLPMHSCPGHAGHTWPFVA